MGEPGYLDLVKEILNDGEIVEGRNGRTLCTIGATLKFDLQEGNLPS